MRFENEVTSTHSQLPIHVPIFLPVCGVDNGLEVGKRLEVRWDLNTGVCTVTVEQSSKPVSQSDSSGLLVSRLQMLYIIVKHNSKKETILNPE